MKKSLSCAGVIFGVLVLFALPVQARQSEGAAGDNTLVYYVHGVPGQDSAWPADCPIDLYIDGELEFQNMKYGNVKGPIWIAPGRVEYTVYHAGYGPDLGYDPILAATYTFSAGECWAIAAHLDQDGSDAVFSKFQLDFSPLYNKKKCRVLVFDCAPGSGLQAYLYDWESDTHPYVGSQIMDTTDRFLVEVDKRIKWGLYIGEADWDPATYYDRTFAIRPYKALMVFITGVPGSSSFKVIKKLHKTKLK